MNALFIIIYGGMLLGLNTFSLDVYIPTLDYVAQALQISPAQAQVSASVFILSLGLGQLLFGVIADRYGRRGAVVLGIALYLGGTATCFLANTLGTLLAGRLLQGLGAAAGQVIARAILRDLYSGHRLTRYLSATMIVFAIGPLIGPIIGNELAAQYGWRAPFALMGAIGFALLLASFLGYRETLPRAKRQPISFPAMRDAVVRCFVHRQSRYFLVIVSLCGVGIFGYLTASQRVFANAFGVVGTHFALLYALIGAGAIVGQIINQLLIRKMGTLGVMRFGIVCIAVAMGAAILFSVLGIINANLFIACAAVFSAFNLVILSNGIALILDPHGDIAGKMSSILGTISFTVGALGGGALALFYGGSAYRTIGGLSAVSIIMLVLLFCWRDTGKNGAKQEVSG